MILEEIILPIKIACRSKCEYHLHIMNEFKYHSMSFTGWTLTCWDCIINFVGLKFCGLGKIYMYYVHVVYVFPWLIKYWYFHIDILNTPLKLSLNHYCGCFSELNSWLMRFHENQWKYIPHENEWYHTESDDNVKMNLWNHKEYDWRCNCNLMCDSTRTLYNVGDFEGIFLAYNCHVFYVSEVVWEILHHMTWLIINCCLDLNWPITMLKKWQSTVGWLYLLTFTLQLTA